MTTSNHNVMVKLPISALIGASISFLTFNIVTFILGKKCGRKQSRTKFVSAVEHSEQSTTGSRKNAETLVPVYEEIVPDLRALK